MLLPPAAPAQDFDQAKYIQAMLQAVKARRRSPWGSLPAPRTRGSDLASTGARLANVSGVMSGSAEVNR